MSKDCRYNDQVSLLSVGSLLYKRSISRNLKHKKKIKNEILRCCTLCRCCCRRRNRWLGSSRPKATGASSLKTTTGAISQLRVAGVSSRLRTAGEPSKLRLRTTGSPSRLRSAGGAKPAQNGWGAKPAQNGWADRQASVNQWLALANALAAK